MKVKVELAGVPVNGSGGRIKDSALCPLCTFVVGVL